MIRNCLGKLCKSKSPREPTGPFDSFRTPPSEARTQQDTPTESSVRGRRRQAGMPGGSWASFSSKASQEPQRRGAKPRSARGESLPPADASDKGGSTMSRKAGSSVASDRATYGTTCLDGDQQSVHGSPAHSEDEIVPFDVPRPRPLGSHMAGPPRVSLLQPHFEFLLTAPPVPSSVRGPFWIPTKTVWAAWGSWHATKAQQSPGEVADSQEP